MVGSMAVCRQSCCWRRSCEFYIWICRQQEKRGFGVDRGLAEASETSAHPSDTLPLTRHTSESFQIVPLSGASIQICEPMGEFLLKPPHQVINIHSQISGWKTGYTCLFNIPGFPSASLWALGPHALCRCSASWFEWHLIETILDLFSVYVWVYIYSNHKWLGSPFNVHL